jgi:hypothetical protein
MLARALDRCTWWRPVELLPAQASIEDRKTVLAALSNEHTETVAAAQGWIDYLIGCRQQLSGDTPPLDQDQMPARAKRLPRRPCVPPEAGPADLRARAVIADRPGRGAHAVITMSRPGGRPSGPRARRIQGQRTDSAFVVMLKQRSVLGHGIGESQGRNRPRRSVSLRDLPLLWQPASAGVPHLNGAQEWRRDGAGARSADRWHHAQSPRVGRSGRPACPAFPRYSRLSP